MKRMVVLVALIVGLICYVPANTEATDHYLCQYDGWTYYMDDTSVRRASDDTMLFRVKFTLGDGRVLTTNTKIRHIDMDYYHIYSGIVDNCTYNDYSGYALDWLLSHGYNF